VLELVKSTYENIYSVVSGFNDCQVKLNQTNKKVLDSFIKRLENEFKGAIDEQFLQTFILFQFLYYDSKKTRLGKGRVYLNWILGEKAIERWKNKHENWFYFVEQYRKSLDIPNVPEKHVIDTEKVSLHRQRERKRFWGSYEGFLHCLTEELHEKYSSECLSCKFKNNCG
jgi:hypothetical protein